MSAIYSTKQTEKLSRKLKRAGVRKWIAASTGDAWGKYLVFEIGGKCIGGKCIGGAGWTIREAAEKVAGLIAEHRDRLCPGCGAEWDRDCQGERRCPDCDGPCPCCCEQPVFYSIRTLSRADR